MQDPAERITHISPRDTARDYLRACWRYRELLLFLARRDVVVRYRQTLAGVLWLLAKPAFALVTFTFFYGHLAAFPDDGIPYPVLVLSGSVAWGYFSAIVANSAVSLVSNINLITKVAFPRALLPIGTLAPNLVDLVLTFGVLLIVMAAYGIWPSWRMLLVPVPLLVVALVALGLGLWFSAACVRYRDVVQVQPFVLQCLFMFSPVGFTSTIIRDRLPDAWVAVYYANPLAAAIDLLRWCLFPASSSAPPAVGQVLLGLGVGLVLTLTGWWYFRRAERCFADVV